MYGPKIQHDLDKALDAMGMANAALYHAREQRDRAIIKAHEAGMTVTAIAKSVQLTRQNVHLILKKGGLT